MAQRLFNGCHGAKRRPVGLQSAATLFHVLLADAGCGALRELLLRPDRDAFGSGRDWDPPFVRRVRDVGSGEACTLVTLRCECWMGKSLVTDTRSVGRREAYSGRSSRLGGAWRKQPPWRSCICDAFHLRLCI